MNAIFPERSPRSTSGRLLAFLALLMLGASGSALAQVTSFGIETQLGSVRTYNLRTLNFLGDAAAINITFEDPDPVDLQPIFRIESAEVVNVNGQTTCIRLTIEEDPQGSGPDRIDYLVTRSGQATPDRGTITVSQGIAGGPPEIGDDFSSCIPLPENNEPTAPDATFAATGPGVLTNTAQFPVTDLDPQDVLTVTIPTLPATVASVFIDGQEQTGGNISFRADAPVQFLVAQSATTNQAITFAYQVSDGRPPLGQATGVTQVNGQVVIAVGAVAPRTWSLNPNRPSSALLEAGEPYTIDVADLVTLSTGSTVTSLDYQVTMEPADQGQLTNAAGQLACTPATLTCATQPVTFTPDAGFTTVTLRYVITDGTYRSEDTIALTGEPDTTRELSDLTSLSPNERAVALTIDRVCPRLQDRQEALQSQGQTLSQGESELLLECAIVKDTATASESEARASLRQITSEEAVAQAQSAIDVAGRQYRDVAGRIAALRAGARGVSLAGLRLNVDGVNVDEQLLSSALKAFGGGASADGSADLLEDSRLGLFARGNYNFGDKDTTELETGYDFDAWGVTLGVDYRFTNNFILGVAASYSETEADFTSSRGGLEVESLSGTLYGTYYLGSLYIDLTAAYGANDYASERHIAYTTTSVSGPRVFDTTTRGDTDGDNYSISLNAGYNFSFGRLTLTPSINMLLIDGSIDAYAETGGVAWDLAFREQDYKSLPVSLGLQLAYVISGEWGVIQPYVRAAAAHEFEDDGEVVFAQFVNASNVLGPDVPEIAITTEEPDSDYLTWAVGLSMQFRQGVSGFIDYQRLEGYENFSSNSLALGVRMERKF